MSKNKFKINSCKACKQNFDITDINNINQCCYDTLAAFEGSVSINDFRNRPEAANCEKCIDESMDSIGRTRCDLRITADPGWVQAPHYFPSLLDQEGDVDTARDLCIETCSSNKYKNECIKNCVIDSQAVEKVETVENFLYNQKQFGPDQNYFNKLISNDYVYMGLVFFGMIILVSVVLMIIKMLKPKESSISSTRAFASE